MAKTDYKTVNEYHKTFPVEIQERMQTIRGLINEIAPEAEEVISYQIPAFKMGKNFLIYYSAYARHISLASPWSEAILTAFATELKDYKVTKSAIQIPNSKPLPVEFLKRLLEFRKAEVTK